MAPTLYYVHTSPPCRAVLLAAKALNVELDLKLVNLRKKEHFTPEFKKLNPQSTVPTLIDDGFAIGDSHAIVMYLANKYGRGSSLYPEDPKARALVDWRLCFNIGSLYERFSNYYFPIAFEGKTADKEKLAKVEEALQLLDTFLEGQTYAAGDNLTLADLSLVATVSTFESSDIDFKKYANIKRWYERVQKTAPGYKEANEDGLNAFKAMYAGYANK